MDCESELLTIAVDGQGDSVRIFVREFVKAIGASYVNKTHRNITNYMIDLGDNKLIELIHGNIDEFIENIDIIICVYSYLDNSFDKLTRGRLTNILQRYKGNNKIFIVGLRSDVALPGKIRHNNNALWYCDQIKHIQVPSPNRADEKMLQKMKNIYESLPF